MKKCTICAAEKPIECYSLKRSAKDGHTTRCKECDKKATSLWRANNPEKAKASTDRWNEEHRDHVRSRQKKYYEKNSVQIMDQMKQSLKDNPANGLYKLAKQRAKKSGVPFTIKVEDITVPEVCPIFGVKLEFGNMDERNNSPSLDRLVPSLGYVPGNVVVVSYRANRIKNEGTASDHRLIADWMDAQKETANA